MLKSKYSNEILLFDSQKNWRKNCINKAQTQYAASVGLVIAGVYVLPRAAQAVLGVLGLSGGIVFNSSPQFIPLAGSRALVWEVGWQ